MTRTLHRWPGLIAAVLLILLALSGAVLSVFPVIEAAGLPAATSPQTVADLAQRIKSVYPGVEQIHRAPSGRITAFWFDAGTPGGAVIDPATGQGIGSADTPTLQRWLTTLHRSLFLDDTGRIVMALGAAAMLALAITGVLLVLRRTGGWRHVLSPLKGPLTGRLHVEIARVAVLGLALSSLTALWMTAATFGLVPEPAGPPAFPAVSAQGGFDLTRMQALQDTPVSALRDLTFPYPDDLTDAFTLQTDQGEGYVDQGTGQLLAWKDLSVWDQITETVYMLHTGRGAAWLGAILGLMALGVPVMAATGTLMWLGSRIRIRHNSSAAQADTILLVGSEGGTTWGFAATLHAALHAAGQRVHTAPMSTFDPAAYIHAARIIVLAATYGNGDAPASAKGFLDRLTPAHPIPMAVLGFGDRSFPAFCGYALDVAAAAEARGWPSLLPIDSIDRQSPQDFARWGRALGTAIGVPLDLHHQPILPRTQTLTLLSRRDYGETVQAPTAILRFALPHLPLWRRLTGFGVMRFAAGDLLGIIPTGSPVPRFYSLASATADGFVEVCVRKHPDGLCSGALFDLAPGDTIRAFVRRNPDFRPNGTRRPVILIGAGTGIGPLAGFVRANGQHRPMHLWFGARHPASDMLYDTDLATWAADGRLASLTTAFSRTNARSYVQGALRRDRALVARLVAEGAQILVCGSRDMAAGVADALSEVLAPQGLTPAKLKAEGRYGEDVY
jgi:sulfite reductase (NADPH) flavoprotein alpha-component